MKLLWLAGIALTLSAPLASAPAPAFRHLAVKGRSVEVRNASHLLVTAPPGLRRTGPHDFTKQEDNGYHFEVTLISYVGRSQVVSVVAERLVEQAALDYSELPPARWPDPGFLSRARGCIALTPRLAAEMPEASGMRWILAAGFVPQGSFAYEGALLVAPDKRHEASVELIAKVPSCTDQGAIDAALGTLRRQVKVVRAGAG
jgi:hypothetical protein